MATPKPVRWGILGTADIARESFLPALRHVGGQAYAVAGRDRARTERYAREHGVERAVQGYEALLDDSAVEAVYVALPNTLHEEWTVAALQRGKAVLCEKPLGMTPAEVDRMIDAAETHHALLWEAFVFPFRRQFDQVIGWIRSGAIGSLLAVESSFHFRLARRPNIRWDPQLGGGALYDLGCYPIHLATLLFGAGATAARATMRPDPSGVDAEVTATADFPTGTLTFHVGFLRPYDTFTRLVGDEGSIWMTNPFHPEAHDRAFLQRGEALTIHQHPDPEPSFAGALRHIQAVLRGEEAPRWTAVETARPTATTLELVRRSWPT
jgi:predicted dehydrogenase